MLQLVTPPTGELVSLDELKLHLRVDGRDEDALLTGLIATARQEIEFECGRALLPQTWDLWLDWWPGGEVLALPLPRLQSVAWIKYFDTAHGEHTLDSGVYFVDAASEPGRIALNYGQAWPGTLLRPINGVCVRFTAGYAGVGATPAKLVSAVKLLAAWLYENRGDGAGFGAGGGAEVWPQAVRWLCAEFRVRRGFA